MAGATVDPMEGGAAPESGLCLCAPVGKRLNEAAPGGICVSEALSKLPLVRSPLGPKRKHVLNGETSIAAYVDIRERSRIKHLVEAPTTHAEELGGM